MTSLRKTEMTEANSDPRIVPLTDFSAVGTDCEDECRELQQEINDSPDSIIILNAEGDSINESRKAPLIFKEYNGEYMTQEYVGVITAKNGTRFVIGSRFDKGDKQFFLRYLFEKVFSVNSRIFTDMKPEADPEHTFDMLLMLMFMLQFGQAVRKGIFRRYARSEFNDSRVRGTIDIPRHIRCNMLSGEQSNGKIAYSVREYTAANPVNLLILKALDMMRRKYPGIVSRYTSDREIKTALQILGQSNPDWKSVGTRSVLRNTDRCITHTVYRGYEPLRITSRLILRHLGLNTFERSENRTMGILLDITKLWEDYIGTFLTPAAARSGITLEAQGSFPILNGHYTLKPDFLLSSDSRKFVLDAKYVLAWSKTYNNNPDWTECRDNIFQILSYMYSLNCFAGGAVFPMQTKDNNVLKTERLSPFPDPEGSEAPFFMRVPIYIPLCDEYSEFSQYMDKQSKKIAELIYSVFENKE